MSLMPRYLIITDFLIFKGVENAPYSSKTNKKKKNIKRKCEHRLSCKAHTQKDLLFPHRVRPAHHKCTWIECHQFKCSAGCKVDDFLLPGEGVLRAAVAREI